MDWDYLIIGSGFGGSVAALRLAEKGYRVLVVERGRRFRPEDFPTTNWDLRRWLWLPRLGCRGPFDMSFLRHVTALGGVGVGGGSLVYANTLPLPPAGFYRADAWRELADWRSELEPHYRTARRMLGASQDPELAPADQVMLALASEIGRESSFTRPHVGIWFGQPGIEVADPYFGGEGPSRTGCIRCGGCMLGCRFNAKNSLDRNYLHLAERRGATIHADTEVVWVRRAGEAGGYEVEALHGAAGFGRQRRRYRAGNVVFAAGVLGTVRLLLRLKSSPEGLPRLSDRVGEFVRTNSGALIGIVSTRKELDLSAGPAVGSLIDLGDGAHAEAVRYPSGSGALRLLAAPHTHGRRFPERLARGVATLLRHPLRTARTALVRDWGRSTLILLYMRAAEGHLRLRLAPVTGHLTTSLAEGEPPAAFMPEATELANRVARMVDGSPQSLASELLLGSPTTAHLLGGAVIGESAGSGVIDARHRIHGYDGLYVVDGSAVPANPGVNPSLTIAALAERAMSFVPDCRR